MGTAIILVGGVMLATCSLIEIEPGKDSLDYRGSASRGVPKVSQPLFHSSNPDNIYSGKVNIIRLIINVNVTLKK